MSAPEEKVTVELKCKPSGAGEVEEEEVGLPAASDAPGKESKQQSLGDDAWAYRVEMAIVEERVLQLEKWKQDKMSNVQYIWAELGAKHVKLGQEQEQLEKLTKLIEKEMQEVEALKAKYQQEDYATSTLQNGTRGFSKYSGMGQVLPDSTHHPSALERKKQKCGRPPKHPTSLVLAPTGTPGKRKRGRPMKLDSSSKVPSTTMTPPLVGASGKRPRGRPRKYPKPSA